MLQASDLERKIGSKMGQNVKFIKSLVYKVVLKKVNYNLLLKKGTMHVHL